MTIYLGGCIKSAILVDTLHEIQVYLDHVVEEPVRYVEVHLQLLIESGYDDTLGITIGHIT